MRSVISGSSQIRANCYDNNGQQKTTALIQVYHYQSLFGFDKRISRLTISWYKYLQIVYGLVSTSQAQVERNFTGVVYTFIQSAIMVWRNGVRNNALAIKMKISTRGSTCWPQVWLRTKHTGVRKGTFILAHRSLRIFWIIRGNWEKNKQT